MDSSDGLEFYFTCTYTHKWKWNLSLETKVIKTYQDSGISWLLGSFRSVTVRAHMGILLTFVPFTCSHDRLRGNTSIGKASPGTLRLRISASFLVPKYSCISGVARIEQRKHFSSLREQRLLSCAAKGPLLDCLPVGVNLCYAAGSNCRVFVMIDFVRCTPPPFPRFLGAHSCHLLLPILWCI